VTLNCYISVVFIKCACYN